MSHGNRFYWSFDLKSAKGATLKCALVQATLKGAQGSHALMNDVLRDLSPKLVIMVGVCGGFDERGLKPNDIIVAHQIFHYDRARIKDDGTHYQPQTYSFTARFLNWIGGLDVGGVLDDALAGATLHIKDFAAGDKVIMSRNSEFRCEILNMSDDIYGIEMEGHGFLHAAWEAAASGHVETAMIKSVSDFGDEDKNTDKDKRQHEAATRAAQVVLTVLRHSHGIFK